MIETKTREAQLLTVREASEVLRLGLTRTKELIGSGEIPSVLIGERSRRVPLDGIRAYVARLLEEQSP